MKSELHLARILTPLAFLAACMVLISALLEPLISSTLAGACLCAGIACLIYRSRKAG